MQCPKCGGAMWDNRETKKNPRQPDFKCKNRACDEAVWLDKGQIKQSTKPTDGPTPTPGLAGLTPQQQANARQTVRGTYMTTMAYMAGAMAKVAKDSGIPLDMAAVQAATFSVYNTMDKKGLIPSHLKPAPEPAPKREPEPPRRAPEPPPFDDYPSTVGEEQDMADLPF